VTTLDALPDVAALHLCGIEGADPTALGGASPKVASTTSSVDDVLSRPDVDALIVCVRNDLCPGVLEAALESSTTGRAVRIAAAA
jgi:predicted dehydrogenase